MSRSRHQADPIEPAIVVKLGYAASLMAVLFSTACPTPYVPPVDLPSSSVTLEVEDEDASGFRFGDTVVEGIRRGPQISVGASGSIASGPAGLGVSYASSSQRMRFVVAHRGERHRANCTKYFDEDDFFQALDCELSPTGDSGLGPLELHYFEDRTGHTIGGESIDVRRGEGHGFDLRQGDRVIGAVDISRRPKRIFVAPVAPAVERRVVLVAACLLAMNRFNGL